MTKSCRKIYYFNFNCFKLFHNKLVSKISNRHCSFHNFLGSSLTLIGNLGWNIYGSEPSYGYFSLCRRLQVGYIIKFLYVCY